MSKSDSRAFFKLWLRNPMSIGNFTVSSRDLAVAMARAVPRTPGPVVELGGGTGVVTQALLDRGIAPEELVVVERNEVLYRLLCRRFPEVRVLHGDAAALSDLLRPLDLPPGRAVVSGLPILSMPRPVQQAIVDQSFAALSAGAPFVQFTYAPYSPLPRRPLGLEGQVAARVINNLPPARVWVYRRAWAWTPALRRAQVYGSV
ncbi:MAG: phospholipid methyltransferase [Rhodospirillaceae bacterium]|nr:phospholipid methyltransferase [Rhodospirillaceae bacterium]